MVTGKGGAGKTTVAAALGLVAARRGLRTIVAEVAARDDVSSALGRDDDHDDTEGRLGDGLHHISIDPQSALEEYLLERLPARPLADLLGRSRLFGLLRRRDAGDARAADRRQGLGAGPGRAPHAGRPPVRPRRPRRARDGPRGRDPGGPADLRRDRAGGPDPSPGPYDRRDALRPGPDRRRRRGPARGDAGQRGARPGARPGGARRAARARSSSPTRCCPTASAAATWRRCGPPTATPRPGSRRSAAARARAQRAQLARLRRGTAAPVCRLPFVGAGGLGPGVLDGLADRLERTL